MLAKQAFILYIMGHFIKSYMMKTILSISVILLLFYLPVSAQQESYSKNNNVVNQNQEVNNEPVQDPVPISNLDVGGGGYSTYFYMGDESGVYLNPGWAEGEATLVDGTALIGKFRYNIYKQKMEAVIEGDTFAFAKPCELSILQMGEHKFVYSTFVRSNREVSTTWFEILCEGDCQLLLRRYIKYRVSDEDDDPDNDKLYRLEEYYTCRGDGPPDRLYISKKTILAAFQNREAEMCDYLKSKKLKVKERSDLVKLFAYYNSK